MATNGDKDKVSTLLDLLPAIFQADRRSVDSGTPGKPAPDFLGRFLLPFEELLLGPGAEQAGIEETVANVSRYFEPMCQTDTDGHPVQNSCTDDKFLPWLAGWVALTLREDWHESRKRELMAKAVQLYQRRGTKRGIEEFLTIYTERPSYVDELDATFRVGMRSRVGVDTLLGEGDPFFFHVRIVIALERLEDIKVARGIAEAIVELQKPAHTHYTLAIETPVFQIGIHSTVGIDTLLG